jgi:GDPmannose 4,6-dehydratase
LGWEPSISFEELVHLMVEKDLESLGITFASNHNNTNKEIAFTRNNIGLQ